MAQEKSMTREKINCPGCHIEFEIHRHKKSRWAAAGVGGLIGGVATESLLGSIVFGAISYVAAKAYDEHRAHQCPRCHMVTFPALASSEGGIPVHVTVEATHH